MIPLPVISPRAPVTAGSQSVTATGAFIVPEYNTLTVTLYGAGGEGGGYSATGVAGGATSIASLGLTANGGAGGTYASGNGVGGAGGTASGGTTNTTGNAGSNGSYSSGTSSTGGNGGHGPDGSGRGTGGVDTSTSGGATGGTAGSAATQPGAGGGGEGCFWQAYDGKVFADYHVTGGGGGGGGKCVKTYALGAGGSPVPGDSLSVTVGAGGSGTAKGGDGYRGQADFSWS